MKTARVLKIFSLIVTTAFASLVCVIAKGGIVPPVNNSQQIAQLLLIPLGVMLFISLFGPMIIRSVRRRVKH